MGKKIKLREAQLRAQEQFFRARMKAARKPRSAPAFIGRYSEFAPYYRARIEAHRAFALRRPEDWRCQLRSRAPEQRFLELVRFSFARYPVAQHLENAWIEELHLFADPIGDPQAVPATNVLNFCHWYIVVGRGGSLYSEVARAFMSKLETHHFLTAPAEVTSTQRAFWYAFARAHTDDTTAALRVARSRLSAFHIGLPFWRDAARFFARNPTSILEMNDLIDFLQAAQEEDASFALRGRSLEALRRRMEDWHRQLRLRAVAGAESWEGHPLPDVEYEIGDGDARVVWRLRQIKTAVDLYLEGGRMHHCVASYKYFCIGGRISIWSLTCEFPRGRLNRGVTLELCNDGEILQCRGFANRRPCDQEVLIVKRWAEEYGLTWVEPDQ